MIKIPFASPNPNFDNFVKVLDGKKELDKVYIAELQIDEEVKKYIIENYFGEKNYELKNLFNYENNIQQSELEKNNYFKQLINFYYRLGYDFLADFEIIYNFNTINNTTVSTYDDRSILVKEERHWVQDKSGMISDWNDYEKFPWYKLRKLLSHYEKHIEFMKKNLPEGMKIAVVGCVFQNIVHWILGYEVALYKIYDDEKLISAVFNEISKITYDYYKIALQSEGVGAIFHTDDLGFKSSTIFSPQHLRKFFFPWLKRFASLAHEYNKPFWYHCCGFKDEIMVDLIDDIKIDALHSFEDVCCPVIKYKKEYGDKIGIIGGIDVDKISRLSDFELRKYINNILEICLTNGRYILGSGNSITNYIPVRNYILMLEVGLRFKF